MSKGRFPEEQVIKILHEQAAGRLRQSINRLDPCCGSKWSFQRDRNEGRRSGQARTNDAPGASKVIDQRSSTNDGRLAFKFYPWRGGSAPFNSRV